MGLLRKDKVKDERVINMQNKIYREISVLVAVICILSILVKMYVLGMGFKHTFTEYIIIFAQGIYFLIRTVNLGIFTDEVEIHDQQNKIPKRTKILIYSLAFGILFPLFLGVRSAILYGEGGWQSVETFFMVLAFSLMFYIPLAFVLLIFHELAKTHSDKAVEKVLDDPEEDDSNDEKY